MGARRRELPFIEGGDHRARKTAGSRCQPSWAAEERLQDQARRVGRTGLDILVTSGWLFGFEIEARRADQAGTRPWRSMISRIFAASGGPAATRAATSRKYSGPSTPGVSTAKQVAIVPLLLSKPCTMPR